MCSEKIQLRAQILLPIQCSIENINWGEEAPILWSFYGSSTYNFGAQFYAEI